MARFESAEAEQEAHDFIEEHGIDIQLIPSHYDGERWWNEAIISNPRGSVTYTDYSPAPNTIHNVTLVMSDLIAFTDHTLQWQSADEYAEDGNDREEFLAMTGRAEVLEAMTGHTVEYLNSIFSTY